MPPSQTLAAKKLRTPFLVDRYLGTVNDLLPGYSYLHCVIKHQNSHYGWHLSARKQPTQTPNGTSSFAPHIQDTKTSRKKTWLGRRLGHVEGYWPPQPPLQLLPKTSKLSGNKHTTFIIVNSPPPPTKNHHLPSSPTRKDQNLCLEKNEKNCI